ncbi:MAG: hypothetical protein HY010_14850 [Acidobacteria bacterium]|nr:hypothetical protein [Acidobacteriota bacterium]
MRRGCGSSRCNSQFAAFLVLLAVLGGAVTCLSAQENSHAAGWVVISVDDYRSLRARAYPSERDQEPPPVEATLTRVDYDLQINGDLATGRASLTVDVLKDGWVRVSIPAGLLVSQARLDGKLLSLVTAAPGQRNEGHLSALLSHSGRAVLQLEIALPIAASAGNESISLPATASGVTRASVQLPRQGVDVHVGGGLLTEKSESNSGSKWLAYGHGTEPLTFNWRRKTEDHRSTQPLRMRGTLTELVSLGEDSSSISAEASVEVTQGATQEVRIHLPEKVTINQVSGAAVADWEMKAGELVVTFLEPVEQSTRFVLTGETRLPRDGAIEVPLLRLLNTERETGGAAIEVLGAGEIKDLKSQGLEEADASDLGEMVANRQSPSLAAFKFRTGDPAKRALSVNIARYTQQAVLLANVEEARYRVLVSNDGKTLVQARYAVRNNQRNFIKITLPPGAFVWSAALSGKPIRPGQSSDGSLLLPLERVRGGEEAPEFSVEMVYFNRGTKWDDKGNFTLALPALDLPISRTGLLIYYPPLYRTTVETGTFRAETYVNPTSAVLTETRAVYDLLKLSPGVAGGIGGGVFHGALVSPEILVPLDKADHGNQVLVEKFRTKSQGGRTTGILPIRVSFPAFGPSVFLVSELTSAGQAPAAALSYERDKKAGKR